MAEAQKLADLHIHSNYSFDGVLSPVQIEQAAIQNNVEYVSMTDHNTMQASIDFWKSQMADLKSPSITLDSGVTFISGVEVTCKVMPVANLKGNASKVHLLIYGADLSPQSPIVRLMNIKHQNDLDYDLRRLQYLISLKPNVCVTLQEIQEWCRDNNVEGEPSNKQIMDFLDDKGIDLGITSERRLTRLLEGMPPVERLDLDAEEVIRVGHASGGVVLMAHPSQNLRRTANKMDLLETLLNAGLDGFELLYNGANSDSANLIDKAVKKFAKKRSMIYSGGSDIHDLSEGNTMGKWNKNKLITKASQEKGIIKRVNAMQRAYENGERDSVRPNVLVERFIADCDRRVKEIKGIATEVSVKKSPKPKNKKSYHDKKLSPAEYYYAAEDEFEMK